MENQCAVFSPNDAFDQISNSLGICVKQVEAVNRLHELEGASVPFIARYRKEATGSLDAYQIRAVIDEIKKLRNLAEQKSTILRSIAERGELTGELRRRVEQCSNKYELDDVFFPFKPKRKTRAMVACERGLEPLADLIMRQEPLTKSRQEIIEPYVAPARDVPDIAAALRGACDIVAERWSKEAGLRVTLVEYATNVGQVESRLEPGKANHPDAQKFKEYFDHADKITEIPGHRFLAKLRGEKAGVLNVRLVLDDELVLRDLASGWITTADSEFADELSKTAKDCYYRSLLPEAQSIVFSNLKAKADEEAIEVFARNLEDLLLSAPAGPRTTMGIDPGGRGGAKVAVVDEKGRSLASSTIHTAAPTNGLDDAKQQLFALIRRHGVKQIGIGSGTGSREADWVVSELLRENALTDVTKVIVNGDGASVYSASDVAKREFPLLDVASRRAISIARRLQDPLAELVKIELCSLGVGQYPRDVNQELLNKRLEAVVEKCVNSVGVNPNRASAELLSYVSGISADTAKKIVKHRETHGRFMSRQALLEVPELGEKVFEQASGFLRFPESEAPLDNSTIHPESYDLVERMAASIGVTSEQLFGASTLCERIRVEDFVDHEYGFETVRDVLAELKKPGRDPRKRFEAVNFNDGVNHLEDLAEGMVLEGVIRNITKFGAFADIGVHQDGLIHISELDNAYVRETHDAVSVGEIVRVRVLSVDLRTRRIALSRKQVAA